MANKPVLIVGGICVLLALASFGLAWSAGSQGIEDIENVEKALDRDNFMTAEDAKKWGLIDEIVQKREESSADS